MCIHFALRLFVLRIDPEQASVVARGDQAPGGGRPIDPRGVILVLGKFFQLFLTASGEGVDATVEAGGEEVILVVPGEGEAVSGHFEGWALLQFDLHASTSLIGSDLSST